MIPADIIFKLKLLAQEHKTIGDDLEDYKDAELIEQEAEQIIVGYCEAKGYLINGFPTEKRQLPEDEFEVDYFCRERYQFYLDNLAIKYGDVADLTWCYVSNFWNDQYESREEYLQSLKDNLDSGVFYDVTI